MGAPYDSVTDRPQDDFDLGADLEFLADTLGIGLHSLEAQAEYGGNLLVTIAVGKANDDIDLTW